MWSETRRAEKLRPGFCLGKPQGALLLLHPGFLPWVKSRWRGGGGGAMRRAKAPTSALFPTASGLEPTV